MTDLYLHVGSNKTATTSLQHCLSENTAVLAEASVLYPRAGQTRIGAHHLLAGHLHSKPPALFRPETNLDSYLDEIGAEIAATEQTIENPRVVISSEMLFWFNRNNTNALEKLFSLFSRIKVIVYLRRQDSYLPSFYSSLAKNGECPPNFETFCARQNLDYLANLDAWAQFVGAENLIARPFAREHWLDGNVISDFFAQIECDISPMKIANRETQNQSLSAEVIELLLATGGKGSIRQFRAFRKFLGEHIDGIRSTPSSQLMTEAIRGSLRQRYEASNRELGRRYFPPENTDALCFDDVAAAEEDAYTSLEPTDYADLVSALWEEKLRLQKRLQDQATDHRATLAERDAIIRVYKQRAERASIGVRLMRRIARQWSGGSNGSSATSSPLPGID
ncbi:MAG: hypothetical protein Cons2KO_13330 [Congregibacter sp.]